MCFMNKVGMYVNLLSVAVFSSYMYLYTVDIVVFTILANSTVPLTRCDSEVDLSHNQVIVRRAVIPQQLKFRCFRNPSIKKIQDVLSVK